MDKQAILALMIDDVGPRRQLIQEYIKDEANHSFEERKEVWLATPVHLYSEDSWVLHLPEFEKKYGEISWYDDFSVERHADVNLVDKVRDGFGKEWQYFKTEEMLNDFIAACMKKGVHRFNYDW